MRDTAATLAAREGRFRDASGLLRDRTSAGASDLVLALEVDYFLGQLETIEESGRHLLERDLSPLLQSRVLTVLGVWASDDGDASGSALFLRQALDAALASNDLPQLCIVSAALLERLSFESGFEPSLPLAHSTRRHAMRCGDPRAMAFAHLAIGRLEARAGNLDLGLRHALLARQLLNTSSNLWLEASTSLLEAAILSLRGDIPGAIKSMHHGLELASESGWLKGIVAALANLAYLSTIGGDIDLAKGYMRRIASRPPYRHLDAAVRETEAVTAILRGEYSAAESILRARDDRRPLPWYAANLGATLARCLMLQGRWDEALSQCDATLEGVRRIGARPFARTLDLLRVQCHIALGSNVDGSCFDEIAPSETPMELGELWGTVGGAMTHQGASVRGAGFITRATRTLEAAGYLASLAMQPPLLKPQSDPPPAQDLDTAVALIELGGHPHILGPEAMAVLAAAECAAALALVARGQAGPRVIATHGCDDRRAMAMALKTDGLDVIPLGEHRDEPWQILAEPRPELEHRCTLIAIRKLIDAAVTLDRYRREEKERAALWPAEALDGDADAVWASEPMSEILQIARRIAPTSLSILITGETGSGKEVLARTIHRASGRAAQTFLAFNCTAVPRDMIESQLFGYRKGAFTGADAPFAGVIRSAAGGTLFLDEIAEIPLDLQPKLLRFLETHEIHPLGEPHPITVDVRVIAATNAPLEQLVADGRLREDLFYRLNVVRLQLPPLRERREEIPPLVAHYLQRFGDEQKKGRLTVSDETLEYLLLYAWPGNLRQLANEMRRVAAMAEPDAVVTPALLSREIQASRRTIPADAPIPFATTMPAAPPEEGEIRLRIDQPLPAAVEYVEQVMVRNALTRARGRVEEAARLLGISRKGLFLKRRRWGIDAFD